MYTKAQKISLDYEQKTPNYVSAFVKDTLRAENNCKIKVGQKIT